MDISEILKKVLNEQKEMLQQQEKAIEKLLSMTMDAYKVGRQDVIKIIENNPDVIEKDPFLKGILQQYKSMDSAVQEG